MTLLGYAVFGQMLNYPIRTLEVTSPKTNMAACKGVIDRIFMKNITNLRVSPCLSQNKTPAFLLKVPYLSYFVNWYYFDRSEWSYFAF